MVRARRDVTNAGRQWIMVTFFAFTQNNKQRNKFRNENNNYIIIIGRSIYSVTLLLRLQGDLDSINNNNNYICFFFLFK